MMIVASMELVSIVTMFNMINLSEGKIYKPTITKQNSIKQKQR